MRAAHTDTSVHEMLRTVADIFDVGVLAVDRQERITVWNAWLQNASGISDSSLIGRPLTELVPDLLKPAGQEAFGRALRGGTHIHAHRFHRFLLQLRPSVDYAAFGEMQQTARIAPLFSRDGSIAGAAAFIQDVTERVASEEELREATLQAQKANQAKSDFLAAMSHELRTPIGAISGYADLLIEGIIGTVTEPQREKLERIKKVGDHLLRVVDQILTFARLEARGENPIIEIVDLRGLIRDATSAVEPLARRKGLGFTVELPPEAVMLRTDGTRLRQILINLLGNAVKFTDQGSVTMQLAVDPAKGSATFTVRDTGRGIAPEDIERIFEPFVQAKSSFSRSHEGTGLGLSVSRQLARLLGGDITCASELGVGSSFSVVLPDAVVKGPSEQRPSTAPAAV